MRRRERARRYQAVLDSIERREYELGLSDKRPTRVGLRSAADAERRWRESVNTKAANFTVGRSA